VGRAVATRDLCGAEMVEAPRSSWQVGSFHCPQGDWMEENNLSPALETNASFLRECWGTQALRQMDTRCQFCVCESLHE
jgi:hypothetical protein